MDSILMEDNDASTNHAANLMGNSPTLATSASQFIYTSQATSWRSQNHPLNNIKKAQGKSMC